ncbi:MAG: hypothetical protein ABWZ15_18555 [Acidimicrobiia bacterium]
MVEIRTVTEAPTAVVAWSTTWRAFRNEWQPALDEVWTRCETAVFWLLR